MTRKKRNTSVALLLAAVTLLAAAGKKKAMPEAYGLVGVSVYHEPGLALKEADVTLTPAPAAGEAPVKMKKLQGSTDSRGEYVFRVPAVNLPTKSPCRRAASTAKRNPSQYTARSAPK